MQTHSSLIPVIALQASLINAHAVGINALETFRQFQKSTKCLASTQNTHYQICSLFEHLWL